MNYSPYCIKMQTPFYTKEMAAWTKALPDVHWVLGQGRVEIHFSREEDLTAFKLIFKL